MDEKPKFVLDVCTNNMDAGLRAFSSDFDALLLEFRKWTSENAITETELWYADIFRFDNAKHIAFLTIENGTIYLTKAPADSTVNPFKRKMSFGKHLKSLIIKARIAVRMIASGTGRDMGM